MSWPWHLGDLWSACCVHFTNSFLQEPDFKALFRKATTTGSVFLNLGQSPKFGAIQLLFLEIHSLNNLLKNPTATIGIEVLLYSDLTSSERLHSTHLVLSKCINSNAVTEWPCVFLSSFWAHILKLHHLTNSTAILAPCCVTDSPQISGTLLSGIAFTDCTATCKPWDAAMGWIATTTSCSRLESFTTHQGAFFDSLSVCLCTVKLKKHDRSVFEGSQRISHPSKFWDRERERVCVLPPFVHAAC